VQPHKKHTVPIQPAAGTNTGVGFRTSRGALIDMGNHLLVLDPSTGSGPDSGDPKEVPHRPTCRAFSQTRCGTGLMKLNRTCGCCGLQPNEKISF